MRTTTNTTIFLILSYVFIFYSCNNENSRSIKGEVIDSKASSKQLNFIGQWLNEGLREELVRDFSREYEFKNQNITMNLKFPEEVYFNRGDIHSESRFLLEQFTKDQSDWDIIRINDEYESLTRDFGDPEWPKKYLVDFSQYEDYVSNTMPELLSEKTKKRWQGIIPGPFLEGQFYALWVNKKIANKIGIDVKQFGMTFDDFLSYVKAADNYNKSNGSNLTILHESHNWPTSFNIAVQLYVSFLNNNEEFYANSINENKLNAWFNTLQALEELSAYNVLNPNCKTTLWDETKFDLIEEKCLFYSNGPWMYNIWLEKDKEATYNCMPTEYPVVNSVSTYPASYQIMWAVPKNSPNRDEAVKFLLELNTPSTAEMWVRYTKCPTGIKGNLTETSFGVDPFENFSTHIQRTYGDNIYRVRENTELLFGSDYVDLPNYYKEVLLGEMTAIDAYNKFRLEIGFSEVPNL